jgi:catechol 2,3-dioxygenase-like lactoylglutathione lyase family enzyme
MTEEERDMNMRLEAIILGVRDVDRAKAFYEKLGWRLDIDLTWGDAFRVVQLTAPGSDFSIQFGKGRPSSEPGSVQGLHLVVADIVAARKELVGRGADVSEVFHVRPGQPAEPGPDPERRSYASFAKFSDPDGNGYLVQEITKRLPGRGGPDPT